jgi:hypothetical protein
MLEYCRALGRVWVLLGCAYLIPESCLLQQEWLIVDSEVITLKAAAEEKLTEKSSVGEC